MTAAIAAAPYAFAAMIAVAVALVAHHQRSPRLRKAGRRPH